MRLNPTKPILAIHSLQYLYVFLLLALFGFSVTTTSMLNILNKKNYTSMSKLLSSFFAFETFTSTFFFIRLVAVPLLLKPSLSTMMNIAPLFIVAGYYLSFFFLISHNFEGVRVVNKNDVLEKDKPDNGVSDTFLYNQVATSSNVGGSWLCFLNGGLNYQIEHHLFPRIQHSHYPLIAPIVREFCANKGIPYRHFPSISENVESCVRHLYQMGREQKKKNKSQ
jgi:fatty acid desaturase (delta-4 desaturase)